MDNEGKFLLQIEPRRENMNVESIVWTAELVEEWICIAAQVERVLPPVGPRTTRPRLIIVRDWQELLWDTLRDDDDKPEPRFQPTNEQVSMWEKVVLRWFPLLEDKQDIKILWWRACGMSWVRIGKKLELNRMTISKYHAAAIRNLVKLLNNRASKI